MRSILLAVAILAVSASVSLAQCPGGVCPSPAAPRRPVATVMTAPVRVVTPRTQVSVNRSVEVQSSRRGFVLFPRLRRR